MTLSEAEYSNQSDNKLLQQIKSSNWDDVKCILETEEGRQMTKEPDVYGNLPLHASIGFKAPDEIILTILQQNPNATKQHGTDYWLPLHIAAMWGSSNKVMEALIRSYPQGLDDVGNEGSIKGRNPRHFSSRFEHNRLLLERSTDDWIQLIANEQ